MLGLDAQGARPVALCRGLAGEGAKQLAGLSSLPAKVGLARSRTRTCHFLGNVGRDAGQKTTPLTLVYPAAASIPRLCKVRLSPSPRQLHRHTPTPPNPQSPWPRKEAPLRVRAGPR